MKFWIDTEFNEYRGALISMAIVAEDGGEFYEVLPCANPGEWVEANVMPILHRAPISMNEFQGRLAKFLSTYQSVHIIADWPEDVAHFCQVLIVGPGVRLDTPPLTMEVVRHDAPSDLPHNALADARGMRRYAMGTSTAA